MSGQFEKGNNFWEIRSKHGRDKLFATPDLMWDAACEYFKWCIDNPLMSIEIYGKDATVCEVPKMRPFTIQGLTSYLNCNTVYFNTFIAQLKETDTYYADFNLVVTRIKETIYNQQFSGASAGFLKENIIARALGLTEKSDITNTSITVKIQDE